MPITFLLSKDNAQKAHRERANSVARREPSLRPFSRTSDIRCGELRKEAPLVQEQRSLRNEPQKWRFGTTGPDSVAVESEQTRTNLIDQLRGGLLDADDLVGCEHEPLELLERLLPNADAQPEEQELPRVNARVRPRLESCAYPHAVFPRP